MLKPYKFQFIDLMHVRIEYMRRFRVAFPGSPSINRGIISCRKGLEKYSKTPKRPVNPSCELSRLKTAYTVKLATTNFNVGSFSLT